MNTDDHKRKLSELEATIRQQDETHDAKVRDNDRLILLDRLTARAPELDLDDHEVDWTTLPDGAEALVVDGGGFDGGNGYYIASAGDDVHVIGKMAPLIPGRIGLVAIHANGTRELLRVIDDPIGDEGDDSDPVS